MGAALLGRSEPGAIPISYAADLGLLEHVAGNGTGGPPPHFSQLVEEADAELVRAISDEPTVEPVTFTLRVA